MNGMDLKDWVRKRLIKPEQFCVILDVSLGTLYKLYRSESLDKRTLFALAHLDCQQAQKELSMDAGIHQLKVNHVR
jgi:hypothetical protein